MTKVKFTFEHKNGKIGTDLNSSLLMRSIVYSGVRMPNTTYPRQEVTGIVCFCTKIKLQRMRKIQSKRRSERRYKENSLEVKKERSV